MRINAGQKCDGVSIVLLERDTLDAPELGLEIAAALKKLYPADFKMVRMADLLVNQAVLDALTSGQDPRRIAQDWMVQVNGFAKRRAPYLLYK